MIEYDLQNYVNENWTAHRIKEEFDVILEEYNSDEEKGGYVVRVGGDDIIDLINDANIGIEQLFLDSIPDISVIKYRPHNDNIWEVRQVKDNLFVIALFGEGELK